METKATDFGHECVFLRVPQKGDLVFSIPSERGAPLSERVEMPAHVPADPRSPFSKSSVSTGHRHLTYWSQGVYASGPLSDGVAYAAEPTPEGTRLLVHALKEEKPRSYGPFAEIERPLALTTSMNGDIFILGLSRGALVLGVVEDVFVDEFLRLRTEAVRRRLEPEWKGAIRARSFSLTALSRHLDRPFYTLGVMSDGNVYFAPTSHHPTRGPWILCFHPREERLENLGDLDEITGHKGAGDIPSTLHAPPVEVDGLVFFAAKEALYGRAKNFPELPRDAMYPGAPLVAFDLKARRFRTFGFAEERVSAPWATADPANHFYYMRMVDQNEGPVHRLDVRTGRVGRNVFSCPSWAFVVGADGKFYYSRKKDVVSFDPMTMAERVVASGVGEATWFNGQGSRKEIYALVGKTVYRLTTGDGAFKEVASFREMPGPGDATLRNGVVYKASMQGGDQGEDRWVRILTLNLATGETRDHGLLLDHQDRVVQELWAMDADDEGTLYMVAPVWPRPGDPYSPRLKKLFLNDSCFLVLRGIKPW